MKRIVFIFLCMIIMAGCSKIIPPMAKDYNDALQALPNGEFTKFRYNRSGYFSSAYIVVSGAKKEGNHIEYDLVEFGANYGPEAVNISIEGMKRNLIK